MKGQEVFWAHLGYYFKSPFHNSPHFFVEIQLLLKVSDISIGPFLMTSHFSKAMSPCWLKEAVFGSRATIERPCTSYLSGQWCKPVGWPGDSLCAKPCSVSGHPPVQGTDCRSICCSSSVHADTYALLYVTHIAWSNALLVHLEAGGVTYLKKCHSHWQAFGSI